MASTLKRRRNHQAVDPPLVVFVEFEHGEAHHLVAVIDRVRTPVGIELHFGDAAKLLVAKRSCSGFTCNWSECSQLSMLTSSSRIFIIPSFIISQGERR